MNEDFLQSTHQDPIGSEENRIKMGMSYFPGIGGGITKEALAWTYHKRQRPRGGLKGRTESVRWTKSWGKWVIDVVK